MWGQVGYVFRIDKGLEESITEEALYRKRTTDFPGIYRMSKRKG